MFNVYLIVMRDLLYVVAASLFFPWSTSTAYEEREGEGEGEGERERQGREGEGERERRERSREIGHRLCNPKGDYE